MSGTQAVDFSSLGHDFFPAGSQQRMWLDAYAAGVHQFVDRAVAGGVDPYFFVDLLVFPTPVLAAWPNTTAKYVCVLRVYVCVGVCRSVCVCVSKAGDALGDPVCSTHLTHPCTRRLLRHHYRHHRRRHHHVVVSTILAPPRPAHCSGTQPRSS